MDEISKSDELVMKLLHYFITQRGYNPIVLHGAKDEIWLENLNGEYKIVRIVSNYIHNDEQLDFDMYRTKQIIKKIKRTTFSFSMNVLSIFINLGDNVSKKENYNNVDIIKLNEIQDIKKYKNVLEVFPDIMDNKDYKEKGFELFLKLTGEINKKNISEGEKAEEIFKIKKPIVTVTLILINFIVFALMYLIGNGSTSVSTLINFGALEKNMVLSGEYFRIITSAFVHIGLAHLLVNCYSLYIIGRQLESFLGKLEFLIIYVISAITGSLLSLIFPIGLSAGASGAIFGLLGALLYFGYNYRVYLGNVLKSQIIPLILLNLILGLMLPGINNAAHIGGLVGGILATMAVGVKYKSTKSQRVNGTIMLIMLIVFLIYLGFFI